MRLSEINPLPDLFTIAPADRDHEVGIRAGLTVFVPLALLLIADRMDLAIYATFAAFTGIYGRNLPHGPRLQAQLRAGVLMLAVLAAATAAGQAGVSERAHPWLLVLLTTAVAGLATLVTGWWRLRPAGALFHIFAFAAVASVPVKPPPAEGMATAAGVVGWALVVAVSARLVRSHREPLVWERPERPDAGLRRVLRWEAFWALLAAGLAGVLATLLGAPHGVHHNYWAMVAAVVPLAGHSTRYRVSRGLQRVIGTVAGLGLTVLVIAADPPPIVLVVLIALLQVGAELFILRQYAIAQAIVTPLALLSTMLVGVTVGGADGLVAAGAWQGLADRVVETVIGTAVGVACVLVPWAWRRWVRRSADPTREIPIVPPPADVDGRAGAPRG